MWGFHAEPTVPLNCQNYKTNAFMAARIFALSVACFAAIFNLPMNPVSSAELKGTLSKSAAIW
jgi:hypothetical protein